MECRYLFISGNVRKDTCTAHINKERNLSLRHYGLQEHDIAATMRSMTKLSLFVSDVNVVRIALEAGSTSRNIRKTGTWYG
jgi:adenosylcobinamide amidohydrolase